MTTFGLHQPAGAVAMIAVAVLIALWLRDRRRRVIPVGTLFLWERVPRHVLERQRFQPDLLFALQLLLLLALIGGLVRPYLAGTDPAPRGVPLVLVLDASASMQTREREGTRFDLARRRAQRAVAVRSADDPILVMTAGERTRLDLRWTRDHAQVRDILETLGPTDTTTRLGPAVEQALAAADTRPGAEVVVLTDLPRDAAGLPPEAQGRVSWVQIGRTDDNVAIAGLTVTTPVFQESETATATVDVRNHGARPREALLEARVDGRPWARRPLVIGPRATEHVLLVRPPGHGVLDVRLRVEDALAVDDHALGWIPAGRPLSLLVVTDSRELADAFAGVARAIAGSQVEIVSRARYAERLPAGRRAALFDRFVPSTLPPAVNALYVAPPTGDAVCVAGAVRDAATVVDWQRDHPMLAGLDGLQALTAEPVHVLGRPAWGTSVVLAGDGRRAFPLLVAGERDGRRLACLGAELIGPLASSDRLPLLMLTLSAIRWLAEPYEWQALMVETGRAALLGPGPRQPVRGPAEGTGLHVAGEPPVVVAEHAGLYRLGPPGGERIVLANLFDDRESDVGREGDREWPATAAPERAEPRSGERELGWWLYVAGAVILALEWLAWRRWRLPEPTP